MHLAHHHVISIEQSLLLEPSHISAYALTVEGGTPLADQPELGVIRKHRTVSGLIRYDARNEAIDWAQAARDAINAEKPQYIVMMVGLNDRQAIRERVQPARNAPGQRGAAANQPAQQQARASRRATSSTRSWRISAACACRARS